MVVEIGGRVIAVLPDEDADLGFPGRDDRVEFYFEPAGGGNVLKARVERGGGEHAHG